MPTTGLDLRRLRRMAGMVLGGLALVLAGLIIDPTRALLRHVTKEP